MDWDQDARAKLSEVPALLRGFVTRKVEEVARKQGVARVTLAVWNEAKKLRERPPAGSAQKQAADGEMPPPEVLSALVRETELRGQAEGKGFRLRVCGGAFGCPRPQIEVADLAAELQAELERSGQADRLAEAFGDRILTHHKLALAVSGCVNGCSEPQTKDFAVLGQARPEAVPGLCTGCRKCEQACKEGAVRAGGPKAPQPDPEFDRTLCLNCGDCGKACSTGAISLTSGYRALVGGRLGRHPRLADLLVPFTPDRAEVLRALRTVLAWAAEVGEPGERLGALIERFGLDSLKERL
jgi:dissimilatory sulfite reductase (desulfoviridin) alpha/beta subunit